MTLDEIIASGEPYFGEFMEAEQGSLYFSALPMLVQRCGSDTPTIIEVGSWAGHSLAAWDKAAEGRARLISIDSWQPAIERMIEVGGDNAFRLFMHNITALGMLNRVNIVKGDSAEVLPQMLEGCADIVFLDGDHRYEEMKRDMLNARRVLRNGGILCGDDLEREAHELADVAAHERALAERREHMVDYHPGITQAVYEVLGADFTRIDRLWAARKTLHGWGVV